LNNRNTGSKTPDSLTWMAEGTYQITLKKKLFKDTSFTVEVRKDYKNHVHIDYHTNPGMYGGIYCQTTPDNALVIVNDSVTNQYTPTTLKGLWPGDYKLTFAHENTREDSVFVTVESDKIVDAHQELADTSVWVSYNIKNSDIPSEYINEIELDNRGTIWMGTQDVGIIKFQKGVFTNYNMNNSPIPSNEVTALVSTRQGDLWIGTTNGLAKFNGFMWTIYNTGNSPLPQNRIYDLTVKGLDVWIGTSQGLVRFDGINWTVYDTENSRISHNWITALGFDKKGELWMGTAKNGIARLIINSVTGADTWLSYDTAIDSVLPGNSISCVGIAPNGDRWFGHKRTMSESGGLSLLSSNRKIGWRSYFQGLLFDTLFESIHFDGNTVFVCTSNGLISFDNPFYSVTITDKNSPLPHNHLKDLVIDGNNTMWMASFGGGLIKYKR
jgi:ligand-binding sensor domain-containing protein